MMIAGSIFHPAADVQQIKAELLEWNNFLEAIFSVLVD